MATPTLAYRKQPGRPDYMQGQFKAPQSPWPIGEASHWWEQKSLGPALLGVVHALVDASTVTAIMRASHLGSLTPDAAFAVVVGYDVIAFGSQVILGWVTDRFASPKVAVVLGLILTLIALAIFPSNAAATVLCAGIGNALFHLGAGADVLRRDLTHASPAGLFVAPGALGLAFGMFYGGQQERGPVWPLALSILFSLLFIAGCWRKQSEQSKAQRHPSVTLPVEGRLAQLPLAGWAVSLLLVSIAVRSLVGMSAARGYARTELLVHGIPIAAFLGKSLGGYVADRLGWLETSIGALAVSLIPIAVAGPVPWLLVGLLAFQMTMPVTLIAVARAMPQRLATAFGWTCLALIVGALPTMLPQGRAICARPLLGLWIIVGGICLYSGLRLVGIQRRASVFLGLAKNAEMNS